MNIIKTEIEGVLIIEPRLFRDSRGYFFETSASESLKKRSLLSWDTVFTSAKTTSL